MTRPRLLDLFCGAGGAGMGYHRAGFYVVGVDIKPQPHYCGDEFYQADALAWLVAEGVGPGSFEAIHASPPCQRYSVTRKIRGSGERHPDLVDACRARLEASGVPW